MSVDVDLGQLNDDGVPIWPPYRLEKTTADTIEALRPVLSATERQAEQDRHLPKATLDALFSARLFGVSMPRELGGWEAEALVEIEVAEAVARMHTSACWNLVVGNYHSSLPGVFCPDEVVAEMFQSAASPVVAGQPAVVAKAKTAKGGIVVSGRYSWGSGIDHADWVIGGFALADDPEAKRHIWVAPKRDVEVLDSWYAFGVSGSGSSDYLVEDLLIPDGWWFPLVDFGPLRDASTLISSKTLRGGIKYQVPVRLWSNTWHIGLVLGAAERAIEEVARLASRKRQRSGPGSIADREVFRRDLASNFLTVRVMRDYAAKLFSDVAALVADGARVPVEFAHSIWGLTSYAGHAATTVALMAHGYAGGDSVRLDNPIQRILRDLLVAQQHAIYSDSHMANLGGVLIDRLAEASNQG